MIITLLTTWLIVAAIVATVLIAPMLGLRVIAPKRAAQLSMRDPGRALLIALGWPLIVFVALASLLADGLYFAIQVARKPH